MKKKVLIVDDEKEITNFLKRKLEHENFEAIVASDGYQGLKILAHNKVDAIITGGVMSEMDGYTFCKRLKEMKDCSQVPILICTASSAEEKEFRKIGIDDYIVKPFKFNYLFNALNRVVSQVSHKIKYKKVLVQTDQTTGIQSALKQIKEYGFRIDVEVILPESNVIEEAIRHQSDIVVFDALDKNQEPEIVITSLKSYVEFRDLKIVLYADPNTLDMKRKNCDMYLEDLREKCHSVGADGWIGPLTRDSFLSLMFEFCKG